MAAADTLELLDWKRRVFALYAAVRATDPGAGWRLWRDTRDELFRSHPQSPLPPERRTSFDGLEYWPYDPEARVVADLEDVEAPPMPVATSGSEQILFRPFARARFELRGEPVSLEAYWLAGYGGGVFLPFRDATSGRESYGGGRYVLDTVKGADLGEEDGRLVLDFNFAYNPSCSYDPGWVCPLAPPANRLAVAVEAGERYRA
jgi:uncharacterized protein (DUF1684 family)